MNKMKDYDDYTCVHHDAIDQHLNFCKGIVNYHSSLSASAANITVATAFLQESVSRKSLLSTSSRSLMLDEPEMTSVDSQIRAMDDSALTEFVYHISAMGLEPFEYTSRNLKTYFCSIIIYCNGFADIPNYIFFFLIKL